MFSRLRAAPLLSTYFVTSPSSGGWGIEEEGNSRFSPPVGFDMIVTVIILVERICVEEVFAVRLGLGVVVLNFTGDALDVAGAAVA